MDMSTQLAPPNSDAKHEVIARAIRRDILVGKIRPGGRLATQRQMLRRFDTSLPTVQRAIGILQQDGFLIGRGRNGTFVTEQPPHLSQYTLLFDCWPNGPGWSRFLTALSQQALGMNHGGEHKIAVHYGINPQQRTNAYRVIEADVLRHRVAGLIFTNAVHPFADTPILDEPDVPRIAVQMTSQHPGVHSVYPDWYEFYHRAFVQAREAGHKRAAVLVAAGYDRHSPLAEHVRHAAAEAGVECPDRWFMALHAYDPAWASHYAQLLASLPPRDRPDVLLVADEHFADDAVAGLIHNGITPGRDMDVIAHCSYPAPGRALPGVRRLGFDTRQLMLQCMQTIDSLRAGEPARGHVAIPAVFENELRAMI